MLVDQMRLMIEFNQHREWIEALHRATHLKSVHQIHGNRAARASALC